MSISITLQSPSPLLKFPKQVPSRNYFPLLDAIAALTNFRHPLTLLDVEHNSRNKNSQYSSEGVTFRGMRLTSQIECATYITFPVKELFHLGTNMTFLKPEWDWPALAQNPETLLALIIPTEWSLSPHELSIYTALTLKVIEADYFHSIGNPCENAEFIETGMRTFYTNRLLEMSSYLTLHETIKQHD